MTRKTRSDKGLKRKPRKTPTKVMRVPNPLVKLFLTLINKWKGSHEITFKKVTKKPHRSF